MAEQGQGEEKKGIDVNEMRRYIQGDEEYIFTIKREKGTVTIKMKSLIGDENSAIENSLKAKGISTENGKDYLKHLRYARLTAAIVEIKFNDIQFDVSNKEIVEKFLRSLKEAAVTALYIKYEDADTQIFEDIQKKN
jgi:hypothetical protein